jgi:D-3-phosphoglycerate dehydrogenase
MTTRKNIIIDFDSTFTQVEALDVLATLCLKDNEKNDIIQREIKLITEDAMNGVMQFDKALEKRIELLPCNKKHIQELIEVLKNKVSISFQRNAHFLKSNSDSIYIISGGFKDFILPVVTTYGIKAEHVFANEFIYDENNDVIGFDKNNSLAFAKGKVEVVKALNLKGITYVIGDGFTDYEIKKAELADEFLLFTENIKRENLIQYADAELKTLDEFSMIQQDMKGKPFPKSKIKVLLLENIHSNAFQLFDQEQFQVESYSHALNENELIEKIKDIHILGIRSKTLINETLLKHATKLKCIGAYCIGTNQIDTLQCAQMGIAVFNAPYSNTRSVVELALGEMIVLIRNVITKNAKLHKGVWDKSVANSVEIRGKKLGIVGYGNIGSQLSVIAEAIGMQVYFYDIIDKLALGNATKCNTLHELLTMVDVVSLHVDGRDSNSHLIGKKEFESMKQHVIFMNLSRGHVVDIEALAEAIKSGKVAGASVDVFPKEPNSNDDLFRSTLQHLPNTILTPHIGGSTLEAQENIGQFVSFKMAQFINKGDTHGSVNFPEVQLPSFERSHRLLHIHENVPGILAKINAVYATHDINIQAQYLKTNDEIGYVITDIGKDYEIDIVKEMRTIDHTIKCRMLY